jgi:hypothetical protein
MDYRIIARLSGGGFSEIFEVEDAASALPERLILKRLNAEMSALPAVRAAFAEEAALLRQLRHPNIVTFRRCHFDPQERVCLLMEKVDGVPLDAWVQRNAATAERVLDLFEQVLGAVDYLHHHAVPFLHLDLKPDNVLVTESASGPQPVLIDFGIARRAGGPGLRAYSLPYGAPEQVEGGALACATDVYALGQMLAEILAALPRPATALVAVVEKATRHLPGERYTDAGALRLEYRRARRGAVLPPAGTATPRRISFLRSQWWLAAAAAGGLALLGGWLVVGGPVEPGTPLPSDGVPSEAIGAGFRPRFQALQSAFEQKVLDRHCALTDSTYLAARDLAATLAEDSEDGLWARHELEEMRRSCQLAEAGGPAGEAVLATLRQKLLSYPRP